jgi:hypothetical protein
MTAFNIVRMKVKPGYDDDLIAVGRAQPRDHLVGLRSAQLIKTSERFYCFIGEWDSLDHIIAARPLMLKNLDASRPFLEEMDETGSITDAVSGEVIAEFYRRQD